MTEQHVIASLQALARTELDRELRRRLTDSLQELVAAVEHAAAERGQVLNTCAIDDFDISLINWRTSEARIVIRYQATARDATRGKAGLEHIAGSAEAVLDQAGKITYRGITFEEEPAFVAPDVGAGD
jgi:hypothetical protein